MGKGTITANLGDGLYRVTIDSGQARATALITTIQIQIGDLDAQITTTTAQKNALDAEIVVLEAAYQAQVNDYVAAGPSASTDALEKALVALKLKVAERDEKNAELKRMQADRASAARRLSELQSLTVTQSVDAWCVDYTEGATGEVATIEIPGEPSRPFLIAPGARAPTAADGKLLARAVMTGPQAYFNAAILPGWQKFKPTYRRGTITAINFAEGKVDVALSDDRSSAEALVINQSSTLASVPVIYQDCGATIFELGDECVVEFQGQNWSNPKVIGFQSNPKQCGQYFVFAKYILPPVSSPPEPGPFTPGESAYFGVSLSYLWRSEVQYSGGVGQDGVWVGSSGKTVSWKVGGDPFNYLYVVYKARVIQLSSIYEYQQFLTASTDYFNDHYWYDNAYYFGCSDFQIAGAAVYSEQVGTETHDVLYFVCAHRPSGSSIDFNYGPQNPNTATGLTRAMYLYFYKKDLVTGVFTKLWEKTLLHSKQYDDGGINLAYINYGNSLTVLNDKDYGPIFTTPSGAGEIIRYGYTGLSGSGYGGVFIYQVSFHPSEIKAVGSVIQNFQAGVLYMTPAGSTFSPGNQIAAAYHPEDGRLCTANCTSYSRVYNEYFPGGTTTSWTVTLSEDSSSFSYSLGSPSSLTGVYERLNVCYPNNNVRFSSTSNSSLSRNFFNSEFTDSFSNNSYGPNYNAFLLTDSRLGVKTIRIVNVREKYFCVFYSSSNSSIYNLNIPKLLSSEFTQEEFEDNTPAVVSDESNVGITPMRIGYSDLR